MSGPDVLVVGAGFAGLYQLYRLREAGLAVRVIERADDVGGTWYWNRYPGARCDVESMAYSYSFSPELEQEWTWTEKYAAQPEILAYLAHVADRFDLRRDITFGTAVEAATWTGSRWDVDLGTGERISARFLVMATGCLSVPKTVDVPGAERFTGQVLHTSAWPHEGADLTGQRVAVIGTGSSGVQAIPVIADQAAELTVFQRTPNVVMPAFNRLLTGAEIAARRATYAQFRRAQRESGFGLPGVPATQSALEVTDEERTERFEWAWEQGELVVLSGSYTDIGRDLRANELAAEFVRGKIRTIVDDPVLAEALAPRGYPFGTKRPCLDSGYYATFNRPHVALVDLRATPITEITATGVCTSGREYGADAIVFATGFDALTGALTAVDIRGRAGTALRDVWATGPRSYLGLAVAGFPNMFTVTGPGSPSVLSNMVVSIEQHVDWITAAVEHVRSHGPTATIEATEQDQDAWVEHVAAVGAMTLFPRADSWYMGANVPGKPRVFMPYVGGVGVYRQKCDAVVADGYAGFMIGGDH